MKLLRVTIVNDEEDDEGAVTVRVRDAAGKEISKAIVEEGSQDEFEFDEKGSIVISAR